MFVKFKNLFPKVGTFGIVFYYCSSNEFYILKAFSMKLSLLNNSVSPFVLIKKTCLPNRISQNYKKSSIITTMSCLSQKKMDILTNQQSFISNKNITAAIYNSFKKNPRIQALWFS